MHKPIILWHGEEVTISAGLGWVNFAAGNFTIFRRRDDLARLGTAIGRLVDDAAIGTPHTVELDAGTTLHLDYAGEVNIEFPMDGLVDGRVVNVGHLGDLSHWLRFVAGTPVRATRTCVAAGPDGLLEMTVAGSHGSLKLARDAARAVRDGILELLASAPHGSSRRADLGTDYHVAVEAFPDGECRLTMHFGSKSTPLTIGRAELARLALDIDSSLREGKC